jgi:uncharacterized protein YfbU (UPF0304 family)
MENEAELLELAKKRLKLPNNYIFLEFQRKANILKILFSDKKIIHSKGDMKEGIIYDYDSKDNLVGIEILDFYDVVSTSNNTKSEIQITDKREIKKAERAARRKNRKKKIVRACCKDCGQPKHYICLEHNQYKRRTIFQTLRKRVRYYSRKLYFNFGKKLGFAE